MVQRLKNLGTACAVLKGVAEQRFTRAQTNFLSKPVDERDGFHERCPQCTGLIGHAAQGVFRRLKRAPPAERPAGVKHVLHVIVEPVESVDRHLMSLQFVSPKEGLKSRGLLAPQKRKEAALILEDAAAKERPEQQDCVGMKRLPVGEEARNICPLKHGRERCLREAGLHPLASTRSRPGRQTFINLKRTGDKSHRLIPPVDERDVLKSALDFFPLITLCRTQARGVARERLVKHRDEHKGRRIRARSKLGKLLQQQHVTLAWIQGRVLERLAALVDHQQPTTVTLVRGVSAFSNKSTTVRVDGGCPPSAMDSMAVATARRSL